MAKTIDAVFDDIVNDFQVIAKEAVEGAAKKAQKDILKEAYKYMAKYYYNYRPKMYKRTKNLHKVISPVFEDHSTADGISIEVGVQYDSSALKNVYRSNSKWHQSGDKWVSRFSDTGNFHFKAEDNGIPEPDWILDNFLKGNHGGVHQDDESTNSLMKQFLDVELEGRVQQYVNDELFDAITRRL